MQSGQRGSVSVPNAEMTKDECSCGSVFAFFYIFTGANVTRVSASQETEETLENGSWPEVHTEDNRTQLHTRAQTCTITHRPRYPHLVFHISRL